MAALAVASFVVAGAPTPASAQSVPTYATWTLAGSSGAFAGTMTLPAGFPAATFTSNSLAPANVPSGATNWIPASTPLGAVYGSSQGESYVNLRPVANNPTSPSTTTYTFASPTPPGAWAFALGDIDADQVEVLATDAAGNPVPVAGLGFQGVFNYCDASPRSAACSGVVAPFDLPTWQPGTTSGVLVGNPGALDTVGATGWFQPTVPLSTLTFVFTQRSGFPVYQTWFTTLTRTISGTVTEDAAAGVGGVAVTLSDADGNVIATTTTAGDGTYSFEGLGPVAGYTVEITPPDGFTPVGPVSLPADLTTADATDVDFDLTQVPVTSTVSGTVTADDSPIGGIDVVLTGPDGAVVATTTTADDGTYAFADVPDGEGYEIAITVPDGFEPDGPTSRTVDVAGADVTDQDFALVSVPETFTVPGEITGPDDEPIPGTQVDLDTADGETLDTTTTDESGEFSFSDVPPGDYTLVITPPEAYAPTTIAITVPLPEGQTLGIVLALAAAPPGAELPRTGTDATELAGAGLALVGLGAVAMAVGRRRRSRLSPPAL
jgi:LPXTG-motif cell wall-anchored protein